VVEIAEFLLEVPVDSVATDRRAVSTTTAGEFDVMRGEPTSMDFNCSPFTVVQSTLGVATIGPWFTLAVASVKGLRPCGERVLPPWSMLGPLPLLWDDDTKEHPRSKQPVSYKDGAADESFQFEAGDAVLEPHEEMHPSASNVFPLI
jgi:hypothetical protein